MVGGLGVVFEFLEIKGIFVFLGKVWVFKVFYIRGEVGEREKFKIILGSGFLKLYYIGCFINICVSWLFFFCLKLVFKCDEV